MTNSPVISVILPVYNAEKYVAEAVESILSQSFTDFELILIDDGSTDGSLNILRRYAARDQRIFLISRENMGLVATLNEGIDIAKGEFIARMDADDIAVPERFRLQHDLLTSGRYDICGAAVQCFGQNERLWRYPKTPDEIEIHLMFDVPYAHPVVMCRTKVLKTLRYKHDFPDVEDFDLWQRAWALGAKGTNLENVLLFYRVHALQISQARIVQQRKLAGAIKQRQWLAIGGEDHSPRVMELSKILCGYGGNLANVAPLLNDVARKYSGSARVCFLNQAFRIAVSAAATSKRPWNIWRTLLAVGGLDRNFKQEAILIVVWVLSMGPQNRLYQLAKSRYLKLVSR